MLSTTGSGRRHRRPSRPRRPAAVEHDDAGVTVGRGDVVAVGNGHSDRGGCRRRPPPTHAPSRRAGGARATGDRNDDQEHGRVPPPHGTLATPATPAPTTAPPLSMGWA